MKFKGLLKISKIEEDELKKEVEIVQKKLNAIEEKISECTKSLKQCENTINNPSNFILSISALNHISMLQKKITILNDTKKDILIEFDKINNKFIDKKSERKGFEKLIEKQKYQLKKEKEKKEQIFLDDLNAKDDL